MRHDLRPVHHDHRAVLVGHLRDPVHVRHIPGHVGGRRHGDDLHRVFLQQPLDLLIDDPALFVHLGVDHLAALPPAQVVGVVLHPGGQHDVVRAPDQGGGQLVQAVRRIVHIEHGIGGSLRFQSHEGQHLAPGVLVDLRGNVRLRGVSPPDGAVGQQLFVDLVHDRLQGRRGSRVVEIDHRPHRPVSQRHRFVDADHVFPDIIDGIGYRPVLRGGGQRRRKKDRQNQKQGNRLLHFHHILPLLTNCFIQPAS